MKLDLVRVCTVCIILQEQEEAKKCFYKFTINNKPTTLVLTYLLVFRISFSSTMMKETLVTSVHQVGVRWAVFVLNFKSQKFEQIKYKYYEHSTYNMTTVHAVQFMIKIEEPTVYMYLWYIVILNSVVRIRSHVDITKAFHRYDKGNNPIKSNEFSVKTLKEQV